MNVFKDSKTIVSQAQIIRTWHQYANILIQQEYKQLNIKKTTNGLDKYINQEYYAITSFSQDVERIEGRCVSLYKNFGERPFNVVTSYSFIAFQHNIEKGFSMNGNITRRKFCEAMTKLKKRINKLFIISMTF